MSWRCILWPAPCDQRRQQNAPKCRAVPRVGTMESGCPDVAYRLCDFHGIGLCEVHGNHTGTGFKYELCSVCTRCRKPHHFDSRGFVHSGIFLGGAGSFGGLGDPRVVHCGRAAAIRFRRRVMLREATSDARDHACWVKEKSGIFCSTSMSILFVASTSERGPRRSRCKPFK